MRLPRWMLRWTLRWLLFLMLGLIDRLAAASSEVEWRCDDSTLVGRLIAESSFTGVVRLHTSSSSSRGSSSSCSAQGDGKTTLGFRFDLEQCGASYDETLGTRVARLGIHEHSLLLLDGDRLLDVSCSSRPPTPPTVVKKIGVMRTNESDNDEQTLRASSSNLTPPPPFHLDLVAVDDDSPLDIARYGEAYDLRATLEGVGETTNNRYRVHSCRASLDSTKVEVWIGNLKCRVDDRRIQLLNSNGCPLDRRLLDAFDMLNVNDRPPQTRARIASMFKFADSSHFRLECTMSSCGNDDDCRPSCETTIDNDETGESTVSRLLSSSLDDHDDLGDGSGASSDSDNDRRRSAVVSRASIVVHVVDVKSRQSSTTKTTTTKNDITITPTREPITGCSCDLPVDVIVLYRLCLGLSLLFALGCLCNVLVCCLNARGPRRGGSPKRRSVPKTLVTTAANKYWLAAGHERPNRHTFEEFANGLHDSLAPAPLDISTTPSFDATVTTAPKRASLASYASLRPKPQKLLPHSTPLYETPPLAMTSTSGSLGAPVTSAIVVAGHERSPPRLNGFASDFPNRTFHSATSSSSSSTSNPSPADHQQTPPPPTAALITSTISAPLKNTHF